MLRLYDEYNLKVDSTNVLIVLIMKAVSCWLYFHIVTIVYRFYVVTVQPDRQSPTKIGASNFESYGILDQHCMPRMPPALQQRPLILFPRQINMLIGSRVTRLQRVHSAIVF